MSNLTNLEDNYKQYVLNSSLDDIKSLLNQLENSYEKGEPMVSDKVYDYISDYYYQSIGQPKTKIGAEVSGNKVKLPIHMGSMDKVKPGSSELKSFLNSYTNSKCISEKVDGISLLLEYSKKGKLSIVKAYTRGDGTYGQDVSPLVKYVKLGKLPSEQTLNPRYIRGELIITKDNWTNHMSDKGKNARNYVSGIVNKIRKNINGDDFQYVDFVAYEYIHPSFELTISQQLDMLKEYGFNTVKHKVVSIKEESELTNLLVEFRESSKYEIDGIIVQDNIYYPRNTSGNPKYAKAFKSEELIDKIETTVKGIEWTPSKDGKLKPVVLLTPVDLNGVTISRATGNNANFIQTNGIGKGAQVVIIRSGDVIPKIISVKTKVEPELPQVNYKWDDNHTDIILLNSDDNEDVLVNRMEFFVNAVGIEHMKEGTLRKLYKVGVKNVVDIFNLNTATLLKADGIKDKSAEKILTSITNKLTNIDIITLLSGLPCFSGLGKVRIKLIVNAIPNFLDISKEELYTKIVQLNGFSDKLTELFVNGLEECKKLLVEFKKKFKYILPSVETQLSTMSISKPQFKDKSFVFSGFRNKDYEKMIEENGGSIGSSISKKTGYLVVKDKNESSSKITKATELGVPILDEVDFKSLAGI